MDHHQCDIAEGRVNVFGNGPRRSRDKSGGPGSPDDRRIKLSIALEEILTGRISSYTYLLIYLYLFVATKKDK